MQDAFEGRPSLRRAREPALHHRCCLDHEDPATDLRLPGDLAPVARDARSSSRAQAVARLGGSCPPSTVRSALWVVGAIVLLGVSVTYRCSRRASEISPPGAPAPSLVHADRRPSARRARSAPQRGSVVRRHLRRARRRARSPRHRCTRRPRCLPLRPRTRERARSGQRDLVPRHAHGTSTGSSAALVRASSDRSRRSPAQDRELARPQAEVIGELVQAGRKRPDR